MIYIKILKITVNDRHNFIHKVYVYLSNKTLMVSEKINEDLINREIAEYVDYVLNKDPITKAIFERLSKL